MAAAPDLLVIGGVVADRTPFGLTPGGAAYYATRAACALGAQVGVLTHRRRDLDVVAALHGAEVITSGESTLTFTNAYGPTGRVQCLEGQAPPLSATAVPDAWRAVRAVLLAPVFHEVAPASGRAFPNALVGVAPQGWMRQADATGRVHPSPWNPPDGLRRRAGLVSLSEEDLGHDAAAERALAAAFRLLVVTRGARGCTVFQCGQAQDVAAFPVEEIDPTGAGDVFAAAFLLRLLAGDGPLEAAAFANAAAAFAVQAPGIAGLPTLTQVYERLAFRQRREHHEHR